MRVSNGLEQRAGRRSISMPNPHYMVKYFKAKYLLETSQDEIMVKDNNYFKANFSLTNPGNKNVNLTKIEQVLHYCDENSGAINSTAFPENLLGFSFINRYETKAGQISIGISSIPQNVCSISFALEGETVEGNIESWANMHFGLRLNIQGAKAVDNITKEKIKMTLPLLGYPKRLTRGDLIKLELEGKI